MDEKTEELRDIFMDVTDEDTVTESQEDTRGSLTEDAEQVDERLREVVDRMRDRYEFSTDLGGGALCRVVRGVYEGESDSAIADALGVSRRVVFRARLDLHLLRDRDTDAPFDLSALRDLLKGDHTTAEIAADLGVSESTVRRYRRVVETRNEVRRVSERYRSEFEDVLTDADLATQMTDDVKQDGLEEATEGMESESDVSF